MKTFSLRIFLVLSLLLGFGTAGSVSAEAPSGTASANVATEQWIGHNFTFLALPAAKQAAGYQIFKVDQANQGGEGNSSVPISYAEHVGKQVTVTQIASFPAGGNQKDFMVYMTVNDTGEKLVGQTIREQLEGLVLTSDLTNARQQFLGTTIYPKFRELSGLYVPGINETPTSVTIPIGSAATVVDVYAGNQSQEPIWLIVSVNGEKAMLPISYSWTNVSVNEWTQTSPWQEAFFVEDPRVSFGWSQDVWSNIEQGNVENGMTKGQIRLSWGKPARIEESGKAWIYGSQKLDFSGDVLNSIERIK